MDPLLTDIFKPTILSNSWVLAPRCVRSPTSNMAYCLPSNPTQRVSRMFKALHLCLRKERWPPWFRYITETDRRTGAQPRGSPRTNRQDDAAVSRPLADAAASISAPSLALVSDQQVERMPFISGLVGLLADLHDRMTFNLRLNLRRSRPWAWSTVPNRWRSDSINITAFLRHSQNENQPNSQSVLSGSEIPALTL